MPKHKYTGRKHMIKAIQALKLDMITRCDRLLAMLEADEEGGTTQASIYSQGFVEDPMRPLLEQWFTEKGLRSFDDFLAFANPPGTHPRPIEDMVQAGIGYRLTKREIVAEAQKILTPSMQVVQ
jgi:hypothetical protein